MPVPGCAERERTRRFFDELHLPAPLDEATDLLGNASVSAMTVIRLQPSDLSMQGVDGPKTASQGSSIEITDTVCNDGPGTAAGFAIGFYFSTDQHLSADDILIGKRDVVSVASGDCAGGISRLTVPTMGPGGPLYLLAFADYTCTLVETNKTNNVFAGAQITLPYPPLAVPASIIVPATNASGSFQVYFGASDVTGVTYLLEQSRDGGAYVTVYSGTNSWANIVATANGVYTFRVKATRTGYADSGYTTTSSCVVTLACGTPASGKITAPGQIQVFQFDGKAGDQVVFTALRTGGDAQSSLLVGPFHWVIQVVHLLLGILAVGIGQIAAARWRNSSAIREEQPSRAA